MRWINPFIFEYILTEIARPRNIHLFPIFFVYAEEMMIEDQITTFKISLDYKITIQIILYLQIEQNIFIFFKNST